MDCLVYVSGTTSASALMPDYPHCGRGTVQDRFKLRFVPSTYPQTHTRDAKMSPENNLQVYLFRKEPCSSILAQICSPGQYPLSQVETYCR